MSLLPLCKLQSNKNHYGKNVTGKELLFTVLYNELLFKVRCKDVLCRILYNELL